MDDLKSLLGVSLSQVIPKEWPVMIESSNTEL